MNQTILISNHGYTPIQRKIIRFAYEKISKCHPENKSLHVSILTRKKDIVEYGVNNEKASIKGKKFGYLSIHAEFDCIRGFLGMHWASELNQYTLWNIRVNRYNNIVNSKPCKKCSILLNVFQPRKVFYSDESGAFKQWQN